MYILNFSRVVYSTYVTWRGKGSTCKTLLGKFCNIFITSTSYRSSAFIHYYIVESHKIQKLHIINAKMENMEMNVVILYSKVC